MQSLAHGRDLDFIEGICLRSADLFQANQFEQSEKRHDDFYPRGHLREQTRKAHRRAFGNALQNLFDLVRDGEILAENFLQIFSGFDALDAPFETH